MEKRKENKIIELKRKEPYVKPFIADMWLIKNFKSKKKDKDGLVVINYFELAHLRNVAVFPFFDKKEDAQMYCDRYNKDFPDADVRPVKVEVRNFSLGENNDKRI